MSRIKSRWRTAALLMLVAAAIAVPARGSSGGNHDVQPAAEPNHPQGSVEQAPAGSAGREALPLPPPVRREDLDQAIQCMADRGFGLGTPGQRRGVLIPRSETKTEKFREAAKECELPPPPTDAQIRKMACGDDRRRSRDD
jgi:hypothetical protein